MKWPEPGQRKHGSPGRYDGKHRQECGWALGDKVPPNVVVFVVELILLGGQELGFVDVGSEDEIDENNMCLEDESDENNVRPETEIYENNICFEDDNYANVYQT